VLQIAETILGIEAKVQYSSCRTDSYKSLVKFNWRAEADETENYIYAIAL